MTIDITLISTHISWAFSNTVPRNEKHFPLFSYGIQQHSNTTTVAKAPNDFFLLLIWPQKLFHLYKSNWNLNCFLIRKYIYFPVCFLLLFQFLSQHTNLIQILNFTFEERESKYAFVYWVPLAFTSQFIDLNSAIESRN